MEMSFQENEQNQEFESEIANLMEIGFGHYGCSHYRDDARLEHRVVMKFSIAGIATKKLRILFKPNNFIDIIFHDMMFQRSYARFVRQNKKFSKTAPVVVYVWGSTSAQNANSLTMIFPRSNISAMSVGFAGLEGKKTSSTAKDVDVADKHQCVEEFLTTGLDICSHIFLDSTRDITVLQCGHTMHLECRRDMGQHNRYTCPICSKSIYDMSNLWKKLLEEVAANPLPKSYQNKMVWILCNDCGSNSNVQFHLIAHKCNSCGSYNTRQTQRRSNNHSCSSGVAQAVGLTG